MMIAVIEMGKGRIISRSNRVPNVTLEQSTTVATTTSAGSIGSPEITVYGADGSRFVDGARYPSLAAVWENDDDDAAFANL